MTMPAMCSVVNRGVLHIRQERFQDAIADLEIGDRAEANAYQAYVNLAQAYRRLDKLDLALKELDHSCPARARAWRKPIAFGPGFIRNATNRHWHSPTSTAESNARTRKPVSGIDDHVERGRLLLVKRKHAEALVSFDAALAMRKDHSLAQRCGPKPCSGWADSMRSSRRSIGTWRRGNRWSRSIEDAAWPGPSSASTRAYRGFHEGAGVASHVRPCRRIGAGRTSSWGDKQLALRDFELAIELDPKDSEAYNGRGFVRASLGRHREAMQDAAEALRHGPTSPRLLYNAARIYAQCPGTGPEGRIGVDSARR